MNTNEFLKNSYARNLPRLAVEAKNWGIPVERLHIHRPRVVCKDGFTISIQTSYSAYCEPRRTQGQDYISVELGYPSEAEPLIADYAEEDDDLTETVYGYVPVELVDKVLEKHGGIVDDQELILPCEEG